MLVWEKSSDNLPLIQEFLNLTWRKNKYRMVLQTCEDEGRNNRPRRRLYHSFLMYWCRSLRGRRIDQICRCGHAQATAVQPGTRKQTSKQSMYSHAPALPTKKIIPAQMLGSFCCQQLHQASRYRYEIASLSCRYLAGRAPKQISTLT